MSVRLAALLRTRGINITFACRPGSFVEGLCRAQGVPIIPWRVRNSGDLGASQRLMRLLRIHQFDIIHVHSRRDYIPVALTIAWAQRSAAQDHTPRLILHTHLVRALGAPPRASGWLLQRVADTVITVSEAVRQHVLTVHHLPPNFVQTIWNGVNLDAYVLPESAQWQQQRQAWRTEWGIPDHALVIGMVGRLNAKGQDWLVSILPQLAERFPDVWCVLVGPDGLPGDSAALMAQARALGVDNQLLLTGMSDDVPAVLTAFDTLVHLPIDEALGGALIEGMAAGLPVVATAIGGCLEIVDEGKNGFLVSPADSAALITVLSCLLESPSLRADMGAEGRRIAEERFSQQHQLDQLQELYTHLCQTH